MSIAGVLNFPNALDNDVTLLLASNNASTNLTLPATISDATLTVASTASFASSGSLTIDNEILFYAAKTSTTFTGCVRGRDGTTAAAHSVSATVENLIVAGYHNILSSAVQAVETKVGVGSSAPANGTLLQGTGAGTSAWNSDVYISGTLGVGSSPVPASVALNTSKSFTNPALATGTTYYYSHYNNVGVNLSGNSVSGWRAYAAYDAITVQGSSNVDAVIGRRINVYNNGSGTLNATTVVQLGTQTDIASGTATSNSIDILSLSTVKSNVGAWNIATLRMLTILSPQLTGGTMTGTNIYGLFMGDFGNPIGTWTNKYALYVTGGTSYHAGNFGIGTTAANSPLHVSGAISTAIATKTGAYTLTATDSVILANANTTAFNVTLPTAVGIAGRKYTVVKNDASAHAVTLQTTSSQTINGAASFALNAQWNTVSVVSDGANWVVV